LMSQTRSNNHQGEEWHAEPALRLIGAGRARPKAENLAERFSSTGILPHSGQR
jgi:hypothetical protein